MSDFQMYMDALDKKLTVIAIIAVAAVIVIGIICLLTQKDKIVDALVNSLKWMPRWTADGVVFGRRIPGRVLCSPSRDEGHVMVIGGSGLGKTSALLVPTVRAWKGTVFAIDISGDIASACKLPGQRVISPTPPTSVYNVFAPVDAQLTTGDRYRALEKLAYQLIPDLPTTSDAGAYFQAESRRMLTGALIGYYDRGLDFIPICRKILRKSWDDLLNDLDALKNPRADAYISSYAGINEKTAAGIKQAVDAALHLYATDEKMARLLHRPSPGKYAVDPTTIERCSVFVCIPKHEIDVYAPLMRLLTAQMLAYLSSRPNDRSKSNVLLALDEFGEIGAIDGVFSALAGLRKNRVRVMMLTQSLVQVDSIYSERRRIEMMDNIKYYCIMSARDPQQQLYCATLLGKRTRRYRDGRTEEVWRIPPERFGKLGNSLVVVHPNGYKRVRKNFWWRWYW